MNLHFLTNHLMLVYVAITYVVGSIWFLWLAKKNHLFDNLKTRLMMWGLSPISVVCFGVMILLVKIYNKFSDDEVL